jgi:oxygen-independent coproporphyrinogen-3 oxidase
LGFDTHVSLESKKVSFALIQQIRFMAGIYIHIPFCRKACHYCNFHFSTSKQRIPEMMEAIGKEAGMRKNYLTEKIETIYFGGGTPSLIANGEVRSTIERLYSLFVVDADVEITLEANPDDITEESLAGWKEAGINRLSIGIQSFFEEDLQWMNRAHNAEQAGNCIVLAQKAGITNISIDLIYGTPTLTDEKWEENVQTALSLNIPHLSCYALTVEPKTALAKLIETKQLADVDADKQARHFLLLTQWLTEAGFEHYEISNFALPGFRSRHNSSYWAGTSYLGLGPSAHSFNGKSRQWNVSNNALYQKALEAGELPFEEEQLTATQQLNEFIMTRLRTIEGISLKMVKEKWGEEKTLALVQSAQKYLTYKHIIIIDDHLQLTAEGKFLADGIAADLFTGE